MRAALKVGDVARVRALFSKSRQPPDRLLHMAVQDYSTAPKHAGHEQIVDFLIANGARPHWSMLFEPARTGCQRIVDRLIAKGAERNVFACAVIGDVARLKKLLQRDPSLVHATTATDVRSYQHFTPLHACAMSALGRESEATSRQLAQVARLLIDRGGDVNAVGLFYRGYSVTPLDVAAHTGGNIALVEILLNRGATISAFAFGEALAHRGRTLDEGLALATRFLQHGFDVHAPYKNATLLHNSANTGGAEVVEWLLANGADVNARDATGRTPLHAAAERNRSPRVIQILRAHGAKPHLTDSRGQIPLDIARQFDRSALLAWLRP